MSGQSGPEQGDKTMSSPAGRFVLVAVFEAEADAERARAAAAATGALGKGAVWTHVQPTVSEGATVAVSDDVDVSWEESVMPSCSAAIREQEAEWQEPEGPGALTLAEAEVRWRCQEPDCGAVVHAPAPAMAGGCPMCGGEVTARD